MKTIIFLHLLLTTLTIQLISSQEEPAPTPPPTPPPTINTGTNSWYYKYEKSGCAQDCLTSAGEDCGGVAQSWQLQYLYTTLEECCTTSTNLILELCISNSRFSIGDYTGSNLYYVGADSKCDKDCAVGGSGSGEDCGGIITSSSVELYNSIEECCGGGSASISNVQYCVSSSDPSSTGTGLFFKSPNNGYCIQDSDESGCPSSKTCQRATQTNKLYTTITECCALDVSWVNPTYCESSGFPTNKWYPNYGEGICNKDCDTGGDECELSNSGVIKYYDEAALCCTTELQSELYCTDYSLGQEPSGSLAWYVTWDNGVQKCAQDCPLDAGGGAGPCGGLITVGVVAYESVDACCETALSAMRLEECQAVSNGEEYLGTEEYYAESSRCVQDCPETSNPSGGGVCGGILNWGDSYATVEECCEAKLPSLDSAFCVDNSLATPVGTGKFVTKAEGYCVQDLVTCLGSQLCEKASSSGNNFYDTLAACCESRAWVQLDYCTSRSVGGYSDKWYKSSNGICAQDKEGSEVPNMSTELFADVTTCCSSINPDDEDCVTLSEGGEVPGVDGSGEWYLATYPKNDRCVKDCVDEGDADCGGLVAWGSKYASVEECCEKRLPNMVTGLCLANSQEAVADYEGSDQYYQGSDRCVKDCAEESAEDCGGIITDLTQTTLYPDISSCCSSIVWLNDDICASNSDPSSTGTGLYFALAQEGYCTQDDCPLNDDTCIRATSTDTLHATIEACCATSLPNVNEVYCTGGGEPTNLWFKDDGNTFCIQDVDSDINGASTTFYESAELCCETSSSLLDYCIATSNGEEYIGTNKFYVQGSRCVQDCPESDTCGGVILDTTVLYDTVELCCASIGWLDTNYCIAYPNPSEMYYSAASNCVKDADSCSGDEECERAKAGVKLYPDPTTCCATMPYISSELCVASTQGIYTNKWFASTSVCSKHCDNGPECEEVPNNSVTLYLTAQACCSSLTWLPLQNCTTASEEGGTLTLQQATLQDINDVQEALPPPPPTSRPTLRPSNEPTPNPTSQPIVGTATADLKAAYVHQQSAHQQYKGEEQVVDDNDLDYSSISGAGLDIDIPVDDTLESPIIEESSAMYQQIGFISCSLGILVVVVWFI